MFPRIFCHLIHICKDLQRYTELCHTENDKGGNKLENILVSCIYKPYQSPSKFTLTPCQKWSIERSFKKSNFPAENTVFLHYLQALKDVIREEQIKECRFYSFLNLFIIIFSLPPDFPALGSTIQCKPTKILCFHMEELWLYKTVQLEFP